MYKLSVAGKEASERIHRKPSHIKIYIFDEFDAETQTGNCIFEIDTSVPEKCNNLIEATWNTEVDLINSNLPVAEFSFSFADIEKKYNPEVSEGEWQTIERQLPCSFYFGYTLEDNNIEWIKCGTYLTTGRNEWDVSNYIPGIKIFSKNIIYFLTKEIDISTIDYSNYFNLITSVFDSAKENNEFFQKGWFKILIPEAFKNYTINKKFEEESLYVENQILQLIAQAAARQLFIDRDGNIIFIELSSAPNDFYLSFEKIHNPPSLTRYPLLKQFDFSFSKPVAEEEYNISVIFTVLSHNTESNQYFDPASGMIYMYIRDQESPTIVDIDVGEFAEICFCNDKNGTKYEYAIFTASDYVTKTGYIKYDNRSGTVTCKFVRTSETTFQLTFTSTENIAADFFLYAKAKGWTTETTAAITNYLSDTVGENCSIENIFVSSETQVNKVIKYITDILKLRNEYDGIENRGYPELDVSDLITAETAYSNSIEVYLLGNCITYDGALSGKSKYLLCM